MKVVVILPTYNERENIRTVLDKLRETSIKIPNHTFVFLVVDDNSPDDTSDIVHDYKQKYKNVDILVGRKQGLGKALLRGIDYSIEKLNADIVVQMDADLSHDPYALPEFIRAIDKGADIAIGSRYIKGGSIPSNWGLHRKIFSVVGNAIVRFGLGHTQVHDWTGGYRAFKSNLFKLVRDEMVSYSGYVFQIAFLHKLLKKGVMVKEIPIQFTDRKFGKSKIAPTEYIKNVLVYVFVERFKRLVRGPFKKFMVVGVLGFIINTLILEMTVASGLSPVLGSILGAECAIISNFIFNNSWTFKQKKISGGQQLLGKFIEFNGTSFGAIIIQASTIYLGTRLTGIATYRYYYLFGVGLGIVWNYIMYSRVIWK